MDDRNNTIAGWVLFAGIVALGGTILTGEIFHGDRPEEMGYPIEGVELESTAEEAKPVAFYLASADAEALRKNREEALRRLATVLAGRVYDALYESLVP